MDDYLCLAGTPSYVCWRASLVDRESPMMMRAGNEGDNARGGRRRPDRHRPARLPHQNIYSIGIQSIYF